MTALADILNLVNASELLRGKKLGLSSSGFAYDSLELKGRVDRGAIHFDEIVLDAQPFDMVARGSVDWLDDSVDMNVAVAPLQAVNTVLKWLPFLGYVLGGGVYAVPVGVRGKLSAPQIVPVAPTAVAGELLGVLGRTLKAPFNLREAMVPPALESEPGSPSPTRAPRSNP
jgi:AsmA-like C-terminal region